MTKRLFATLLFIAATYNLYGAWWNMNWIEHPNADSESQIWFRKQYILPDNAKASIAIVSYGRYILYVNGRNVSTDVLMPYKDDETKKVHIINFDVARFLHKGKNTVAVWYSPLNNKNNKPQIAVDFYGESINGEQFSYTTDSTWICRISNAKTTIDGNEIISGLDYLDCWKDNECSFSDWQTASAAYQPIHQQYDVVPPTHLSKHISHIYTYNYFQNDGNKILYDFGHSFRGWVRITLRGMRKGEKLDINGLTYTCTGEMDEQACRRFTEAESGRALVTGSSRFSIERIMKIEGIEISPYLHLSFLY